MHRQKKSPNDVVLTPLSLVRVHLELVLPTVREEDVIYDPFFGTGNYFNHFQEVFGNHIYESSEITQGRDFYDFAGHVDVIVSNPPFSQFKQVLAKCVSLRPRVISLVFGALNFTPARIRFMNSEGYVLTKMHMTCVRDWFGYTVLAVFELSESSETASNIVGVSDVVHMH